MAGKPSSPPTPTPTLRLFSALLLLVLALMLPTLDAAPFQGLQRVPDMRPLEASGTPPSNEGGDKPKVPDDIELVIVRLKIRNQNSVLKSWIDISKNPEKMAKMNRCNWNGAKSGVDLETDGEGWLLLWMLAPHKNRTSPDCEPKGLIKDLLGNAVALEGVYEVTNFDKEKDWDKCVIEGTSVCGSHDAHPSAYKLRPTCKVCSQSVREKFINSGQGTTLGKVLVGMLSFVLVFVITQQF